MKACFFTFLLLLALRSQGQLAGAEEPIGQRFGMSPMEVIDSLHKEGIYHYEHYGRSDKSKGNFMVVMFMNNTRSKILTYTFDEEICVGAKLLLPMSDMSTLLTTYDARFVRLDKQKWETPYGRIDLTAHAGTSSERYDHKPHLKLVFDSKNYY